MRFLIRLLMRLVDRIFDKIVDDKIFENIVDYLKLGSGTQNKKTYKKPKHAAKKWELNQKYR